jgi:hypothetical protein
VQESDATFIRPPYAGDYLIKLAADLAVLEHSVRQALDGAYCAWKNSDTVTS